MRRQIPSFLKMKILQVIPVLETGGAQRLLADMLSVMARRDDLEITVAVYRSMPDSPFERQVCEDSRLKFVDLNCPLDSHLKIIARLRKLIKGADVCHVHLFPALYHAAVASVGLNTRMVYTEHSTYNRRRNKGWLRQIERLIYSQYDNIAGISRATNMNLMSWLGPKFDKGRFGVVPNGIDLTRFEARAPTGNIEELRKRLFGREGLPILMISRFVDSKDHPTLIRAIAEIENKNIYAAFIGVGKRKEEYERLAIRSGVKDRIIFLGERTNIEDYVAGAELGVQSSNWEGFGLTVTEMLAGGLPVIVSDVSGMGTLVDGVGKKFPRGDYKALAWLIEETIGELNIPGRREAISDAGRRRAGQYDISKTANAYLAMYTQTPS